MGPQCKEDHGEAPTRSHEEPAGVTLLAQDWGRGLDADLCTDTKRQVVNRTRTARSVLLHSQGMYMVPRLILKMSHGCDY